MYVPAVSRHSSLLLLARSVSQADLERIETTLRDLTNGTNELSLASFKRDVFSGFLPEKLANVGPSPPRCYLSELSPPLLAALSNLHECLSIEHDIQGSNLLLRGDLLRHGEGAHAA